MHQNVSSCGCLIREASRKRLTTHGQAKTKLYAIWNAIIGRCETKTATSFPRYGARGITMCKQWRDDFTAFHKWAYANGYRDGLTIDRRSNHQGYRPSNCRWVTATQNANNKRNNRRLTYNSRTQTLAEWSRETGLSYKTLSSRLCRGWTAKKTLTAPIDSSRSKRLKH
jgi:hypothetical protein